MTQYIYEKNASFLSDIKHGSLKREKRKTLDDPPETPGPGAYTCKLKPHSPTAPRYSIVANHEIDSDPKNPGPAEYSPKYECSKVRPSSVKYFVKQIESARVSGKIRKWK